MSQASWIILTHTHKEFASIAPDAINSVLPMNILRSERLDVNIHSELPLGDYAQADWQRLQNEQATQLETKVRPLLDQGHALAYFGGTNLPLAIDLGYRVNSWPKVQVFLYDRDKKTWHWPGYEHGQAAPLARVDGIPEQVIESAGDVILRVSVAQRIHPDDCRVWVPDALADVHVHLGEACGITSLRSPEDLDHVVEHIRRALQQLHEKIPNLGCIHLFAAVPAGLAFRIGTLLNPTIHLPVQTYQYAKGVGPRNYQQALRIAGSHRAAKPKEVGILFVSAVPRETEPLRFDRELRDIMQRLKQGKHASRFHLKPPQTAAQAKQVQSLLREYGTQIVHFSGHGAAGGFLMLEDNQGIGKSLPVDGVRELFRLANRDHRILCVVLNVCYSDALAGALVRTPAAVPCAIGTKAPIDDDVAIEFADGFYSALADGETTLQIAFDWAKNQVQLNARRPSQAERFVLEVAEHVDRNQPWFG